ncbi:MAG: glycoside hydrolase family 3 N-terminal domain-containing protein [Kiritimatiellae bacterium]|nr:glycoside hydrolase family 3 N-terminal domain-containing protein [Kiritimatiellia bacterium]
MKAKAKTIDALLGKLTPEQKAGQLMVLGLNGTMSDPETENFIDNYYIGGLRLSPYIRKFIRYLPDGSPGVQNVLRPPLLSEKLWDENLLPPSVRASEYADLLNRLRRRANNRKHFIPIHTAFDYESGEGSNFIPPGMLTLPSPMGLGRLHDLNLIRRCYATVGRQLKAIGIDHVHGPVVDVNTNPLNPEVSTRSFSPDAEVVTDCARAALQGWKMAGIIATLKHYPGRGASASDSHFGLSAIAMDKAAFYRQHVAPYVTLCAEKVVPAVMPAHSIYPALDPTGEIATVSKPIITGILREELGFDGIITTDSMTMGGLMAKYTVGEAVVKAIEAGVDLVLLKDDNSLRYEAHKTLADAIRSGRISETRVNESLRRIWSVKWDYGLFADGGIVKTKGLDARMFKPADRKVGTEAARRVINLMRDKPGVLPFRKEQKVLVVDRITQTQKFTNDYWNHPAMLWEFMLEQSPNVSYIDYQDQTIPATNKVLDQVAGKVDVIVVTGAYNRNLPADSKSFLTSLKRFGKPVILVSNNPYELIVPQEIDTVIVSYSLLHDGLRAVSRFLYGAKK